MADRGGGLYGGNLLLVHVEHHYVVLSIQLLTKTFDTVLLYYRAIPLMGISMFCNSNIGLSRPSIYTRYFETPPPMI